MDKDAPLGETPSATADAASASTPGGVDAQGTNEQEMRKAEAGKEAKPFAPAGDAVWLTRPDDKQDPSSEDARNPNAGRRNAGREEVRGEPAPR